MKAEWNDAPEYIRRRPRRGAVAWLIPGLIGTAIMLAALQTVSSAFLKGTAQGIVDKRVQPKPAPVAEITRAEPVTKDWDRVVEEVAARGATPRPQSAQSQTNTVNKPSNKQTIFTDANYSPRGADNVLSFREMSSPVDKPSQQQSMEKIIVVGQKTSMKDKACWPYKEGSIARRNCRSNIGLNYRD